MAKFIKYTKTQYREAFISIDPMAKGMFAEFKPSGLYANLEAFISDRDFPLTRLEVICLLKKVTGNWPSVQQVDSCSPDDYKATMQYRREELAEYKSIYG
jgi:hypothetical protein